MRARRSSLRRPIPRAILWRGVLFGLFPKDAKEFTKAIATAKTDKAGKFEFKDVPYGDWQIVELEPLPGYVPLSDSIRATVDSSTVTLEDI